MSFEAEIAEDVTKFGWSCADVSDGQPPFAYSIGLMQTVAHPELIVFGLNRRIARRLLGAIVQRIRDGEQFDSAEVQTIRFGDHDSRIAFRNVHLTQHPLYLGYAMGYCRESGLPGEFAALQVFWPDQQDRFPFDVGFDSELSNLQPRLDIPLTPREIREFERQFE